VTSNTVIQNLASMSASKPQIRTRKGNVIDYLSARFFDVMPERSDNAEILYHEYGTQLRRTTNGDYMLNVMCGGVGQHGIEIALTPQEIEAYRTDEGDAFIHYLGEDICDDPNKFETRI
jgi:hypothetical protein